MGLGKLWKNYKVLIVMGPSLGLIHCVWYYMQKANLLQQRSEGLPEPAIVTFLTSLGPSASGAKSKSS